MENKTPTQTKFILLRSDGISFDKIAKELKVSKVTLIQWSKLFEDNIKELQFLAMVEIKKQFSHSIKSRYEILLKQLDKIDNAIKQNKKVFIFVGLFHLDFKDGLLELLKKRDYKIEEIELK